MKQAQRFVAWFLTGFDVILAWVSLGPADTLISQVAI